MPTPNKGESKSDFISRFMGSSEAKKSFPDEKQRLAVANSMWKKHSSKEGLKDWRILEFVMPIEEKAYDDGQDFIIRGVAINECTTLNNVKYVADELAKSAPTFRNVPILLDHRNEVKNIVGRTTNNVAYNSVDKRINFEAKIMDPEIQSMIRDGRIQSVSIGAKVDDLTEEMDGSKKAVGIRGLEISMVAVPGDSQASLAQSIDNSLHLKEMSMLGPDNEDEEYDEEEKDEDEEIDESMDEKDMKAMMKKKHPEMSDKEIDAMIKKKTEKNKDDGDAEDKKDKGADEDTEDKTGKKKKESTEIQLKETEEHMAEETKEVAPAVAPIVESVKVNEVAKELEQVKELIAKLQLENAKRELKALETKNETKGIVTEEKVQTETASDIVVERAENGKGYALFGDYKNNPKLNRLKR